jgi:cysteine desulfuration protein SufE
MDINKVQDEIIEEFNQFEEWMDKYEYLIELSKQLPVIDPQFKNDEYAISGCQSKVWLKADLVDGKVEYTADSDAIITKGIVALLVRVISGRKPQEIMNTDLFFIDKTGLKQNLSPSRSNGLLAMVKQMRLYAIAYDAKLKKEGN